MTTATRTRSVLVTGASRGIGLETVRQLLNIDVDEDGTCNDKNSKSLRLVIATARNPETATELQSLLNEVQQKQKQRQRQRQNIHSTIRFKIEKLEVTSKISRQELCQRLKEEEGEEFTLDVLINNAGLYNGGANPVYDAQTMMDTNYYGPKELSTILEQTSILKPQTGLVINVSSGIGQLSSSFSKSARGKLLDPNLTEAQLDDMVQRYIRGEQIGWQSDIYGASKTALNALSRIRTRNKNQKNDKDDTATTTTAANTNANAMTDMTCVCPGWVRTDMGGSFASRSVENGAETIVWLTNCHLEKENQKNNDNNVDDDHSSSFSFSAGKFYRDKNVIPW